MQEEEQSRAALAETARGQRDAGAGGAPPPQARVHAAVEDPAEEYDVFKHSLLRYFGYANELGESFRPLIHPRWVALSYGVAGTYVAADCAEKYWRAQQIEKYTVAQRRMLGASRAIDTGIWQGLASVAIPGLVINRIVWAVSKAPLKGRAAQLVPTVSKGGLGFFAGKGCPAHAHVMVAPRTHLQFQHTPDLHDAQSGCETEGDLRPRTWRTKAGGDKHTRV
jgi:hypothetical protein|eukprot:Tamp_23480.p2 GENE.Tamp_23480~~Tamp_23480.p2  ORF type:complete len:223 (-),score=40.14 Tamp_23480:77-745(-)